MTGKKKADVEVVLVHPTHNGEAGEKRTVTAEQAESLVARGLVRLAE